MSIHSANDRQSIASSLNRVGSVSSIFKQLFKRTGTSAQSAGDGKFIYTNRRGLKIK